MSFYGADRLNSITLYKIREDNKYLIEHAIEVKESNEELFSKLALIRPYVISKFIVSNF